VFRSRCNPMSRIIETLIGGKNWRRGAPERKYSASAEPTRKFRLERWPAGLPQPTRSFVV